MRRSRFTEAKIIGMIKEQDAGMPTSEVCRKHGLSKGTIYIYGCLSHCKIFSDLFRRQVPGCKHLSGVTG